MRGMAECVGEGLELGVGEGLGEEKRGGDCRCCKWSGGEQVGQVVGKDSLDCWEGEGCGWAVEMD